MILDVAITETGLGKFNKNDLVVESDFLNSKAYTISTYSEAKAYCEVLNGSIRTPLPLLCFVASISTNF